MTDRCFQANQFRHDLHHRRNRVEGPVHEFTEADAIDVCRELEEPLIAVRSPGAMRSTSRHRRRMPVYSKV